MSQAIFVDNVLLPQLADTGVRPLPDLAFRTTILSNPYTLESLASYAKMLASKYPAHSSLIDDIIAASSEFGTRSELVAVRRRLVDLEKYLELSYS